MNTTNEKQILKIIKYTAPLFMIFMSFSITMFLYYENKSIYNEEKTRIENNYIKENKEKIKKEVYRVYEFIEHTKKTTEKQLEKELKHRVYEAHKLAMGIYNQFKDTKTKKEILELIKISLGNIRFNDGRGYFFMDDIHGNKVLYPIDKKTEGENLLDFEDAKGYKIIQTIVDTIKNKSERFDSYYWVKPNAGNEVYKKISFYKYFEPLNMAIGTGEYLDEYVKQVQQRVLDHIGLIKYGKTGYIFIIDYNYRYLSHIKKEYINKTVVSQKDTKEIKRVVDDIVRTAKEGEGFVSYVQIKKPTTGLTTNKISFIKGVHDWGWSIGTGFYEDDVLNTLEERKKRLDDRFDEYIYNIILISILLTVIMIFVSIYISSLLEKKFNLYKEELSTQQSIVSQQSKMAAMGEMIGNIAHQWRQPLSIISTASSGMALHKELGTLTDEFFDDATKRINKATQHLSETIDDFRNFFSPNKEKVVIDLQDTLNKVLSLVDAQFKAKDIELVMDTESIKAEVYENELIQALINILNNARDELLKKDMDKKLIRIHIHKHEGKACVCVFDNAGGVPDDVIDRVFEPYFTTKNKSQGTGIGLYMTEEIITKHLNGNIKVFNKEFEYKNKKYYGANFRIELEIVE